MKQKPHERFHLSGATASATAPEECGSAVAGDDSLLDLGLLYYLAISGFPGQLLLASGPGLACAGILGPGGGCARARWVSHSIPPHGGRPRGVLVAVWEVSGQIVTSLEPS
ncbi:hypothetical protein NDU88_009547 [Pleurodeles waltl]|uniref:Uncharacterized protein n=1 Tax=Pleurodeles waltl TaxID=8319 RepID=A0AAV7S0R8_PLEWA|nr:hypothetical protein NDU88_009547 [Pleurodeles waltl]